MRDELADADLSSFRASISHRSYVLPSPRRPLRIPVALRAPRRLARQLLPDLVHGLYLSGHGWTAHAFGVRPLVLSALGSDALDLRWRGHKPVVRHAYAVWRTRAAVEAADVVFADSTPLAAAIRESVPGTETRIVRFGVEVNPPSAAVGRSWRRRLGLRDDAFVLLSSRLLRPQYNIDTIIRALPAIRRALPQAVLVLKELPRFSDPGYQRLCLALADELGVRDAVQTVGELDREDLLELHAEADVYISVPETDGTAVSVLEAMAAGVAVVASEAPGIDPAILRHDETALLVPTRDPDSLASAVVALATDAARRKSLIERAREVVREHGNFDRELDRAVRLYEELVASHRV
jgi:glycosyltransferase involved in cell wall biosynthesis